MSSKPRVLSIAGTDPTGGAGIHADLKAIGASGGYGMAVTTALVAQNTCGVREIFVPPIDFLQAQLDAVFDDVAVDAVKIGMLGQADVIECVAATLRKQQVAKVVLDPVMVATSGHRLLDSSAYKALLDMVDVAGVITPNIPELAEVCRTIPAQTLPQAVRDAQRFADTRGIAVVVKAGHLADSDAGNTLVRPGMAPVHISTPRQDTKNTHGTGCSLSSAIATRWALSNDLEEATTWATHWLAEAIAAGSDLEVGQGHGPVDHFVRLQAK